MEEREIIDWSEEREERGTGYREYGCICGFNKKEFTNHVLAGRRDGKGVHKSLDRINLETNEAIVPLYAQRSDKQKSESRYAQTAQT